MATFVDSGPLGESLNQTYQGNGTLSLPGGDFVVTVDGTPAPAAVYLYDDVLKSILVARGTANASGEVTFSNLNADRLYFMIAVAADGRSAGFSGLRPVTPP